MVVNTVTMSKGNTSKSRAVHMHMLAYTMHFRWHLSQIGPRLAWALARGIASHIIGNAMAEIIMDSGMREAMFLSNEFRYSNYSNYRDRYLEISRWILFSRVCSLSPYL